MPAQIRELTAQITEMRRREEVAVEALRSELADLHERTTGKERA